MSIGKNGNVKREKNFCNYLEFYDITTVHMEGADDEFISLLCSSMGGTKNVGDATGTTGKKRRKCRSNHK